MITHPSHIIIQNRQHQVYDLLAARESRLEEPWQSAFFDFLAAWYDDKSYIEVHTSGSTGAPKLIRLAKDFVAHSAQRTINFFGLKPGDKVLHCLPSNFIAGKLMLVRALIGKLNLHLVNPSTSFDFLAHEHYVFAALVVNQMQKLLHGAPHIPIDYILLGGSAIPQALETQLMDISSMCYSSYAMTETATHIALRKLNRQAANNYYRAFPDVRLSLDARNCLQIKMPGLESKLITNDVAELMDSHTFRIVGRADNCIICGGKKFFPEEIEQKLSAAIHQPFFIGSSPDDVLGEVLTLVVEAPFSEEISAHVKQCCHTLLPKHEQPRQFIFTEEFPRTKNGKLKRFKL
ncbi:MAG: AMP-binding protein [Mangrovibacterium sp.]